MTVHRTWMKKQPMTPPEILSRVGITLLAVIGPALGGVRSHLLCQYTNVTVPLLNDTGTPEANGLLLSDPVPIGVEVTCNTWLSFNTNVKLTVMLTKVLIWNQTKDAESGGYGWKLAYTNGRRELLWTQLNGRSWKNYSAESCPYLFVDDASKPPIPLRVNSSQEFITSLLEITLRKVPESESCDVTIQYTASVPRKELCHSAREFYCESSAACVSSRERCNGYNDCSNGEDEDDCNNGTKMDAFTFSSTAGVASVAAIAIMAAAVLLAVLLHYRRSLSIRCIKTNSNEEATYSTVAVTSQDEQCLSKKPVQAVAGRLMSPSDTRTDVGNEPLYDMVDPRYHTEQPQTTLRPDQSSSDSCDLNAYDILRVRRQ